MAKDRSYRDIKLCSGVDVENFLASVSMDDHTAYAKALLKAEKACWFIDPILVEELWAGKVHSFLEKLAN